MGSFTQYMYFALWAILTVYMLFQIKRAGAMCLIAAALFAFMTVWEGLRVFGGMAIYDGVMGIIFRCVAGGFLLIFVLLYILSKIKRSKANNNNEDE